MDLTTNLSVTTNATTSTHAHGVETFPPESTKYISDEILYWSQLIGYVIICGSLSILGIVANSINIITFIRQGVFNDSHTFTLMSLSISDLISLVFLLWFSMCFVFVFIHVPELPFYPMDMILLIGARPHLAFVQLSSWITVYVAFERCMCVVFPFKVGTLFTAKRTAIIIPSLAVVVIFGCYTPYYVFEHFVWDTIPGTNKSMLVIFRSRDRSGATGVFAIINAFISPPLAMFLVFCFTQTTAFRIDASTKWRRMTTAFSSSNSKAKVNDTKLTATDPTVSKNAENSESSSQHAKSSDDVEKYVKPEIGAKEKRLIKMIWVICVIFIVCLTPDVVMTLVTHFEPNYTLGSKYHNVYLFSYVFTFTAEAINGSVNILVYYNMSTKYRGEFRKLFGMDKAKIGS